MNKAVFGMLVGGGALGVCVALAATLTAAVATQAPAPSDPLSPLDPLIGRWIGTAEGEPGKGTVEREYVRLLGSRFIQVRNKAVYPPRTASGTPETHEDLGIFSYDTTRKRIIFRQFHVEGFVNQYVEDPSTARDLLRLTSEAIENIPAGWRARETYRLLSADQFEEVFELAGPGKDFALYSRSRLRRVR